MGAPFRDITLYLRTPHSQGTSQYWEEAYLQNFVSDLYVQKMNGYKPPKTSRITIQPEYYGIWDRTWKTGSIASIAVEFLRDKYERMNKPERYKYILDIIQSAVLQLSEEYKWDIAVFEKAYQEVLASNFTFKADYPSKISKDKKKRAHLSIEKTETLTTCYAIIQTDESTSKVKLFENSNWYWYDPAYKLVKQSKWYDTDQFGIYHAERSVEIIYSISNKKVSFWESGVQVKEIAFNPFLHLK